MDTNGPMEVSITQCNVCGSITTHWGWIDTPGACSSCVNAAEDHHNNVLEADAFRDALSYEINKWAENESPDDGSFLENLDQILGEYDDSHDDNHPIFGTREWDELNETVPLLNSIANTIYSTNEELGPLLEGINELLLTPSSHWKYMQQLEMFKIQIEPRVNRINESILECQSLGFDVVDFEASLISALSHSPEFWFEGKDDLPGNTAVFFFDGSTNSFNSFTHLGEPCHYRRHFNLPE